MSTPHNSSIHICMSQHCSTQSHPSPEGDGQGVAFTPFQDKQHIKNLQSAIESNSIPNMPTSGSQSEFQKILLDQIFSTYYSQLNQSKFSTPAGLNSTAQKSYSGKFISLFEPHTQNTTNMEQNFRPSKHFISQPFKKWLARFLQQARIMEVLHQHQQSQIPKGSPKCDNWDGLVLRGFTGFRNINDPPLISIPGALAFLIYVDWFNAHGKSTQFANIGPIILICLNLPPRECLCCRNHPWSKGANCPTIDLPIISTHQGAQRAMARLPFFTNLNRSFGMLYPCFHPHGHCRCGFHEKDYWI
ncbi:hypothetical protein O181_068045 [Austropuccinia psidii MF-1]|uniref:Uncharacterized protein n=1 Tax=Austropuccinia psidii MF-1 TaxID=1389203 RepID=A0A9Q3ERV8_9BASI|nr:hypothetical protein [Austropuccinia psidii MF-1]